MMEPRFCACSAVLHTRCRSLFAMSSEKENDDPNPVPSKKRKLFLSRKGKERFSSVSEHQLTVMSKPQVPKTTMESVNHKQGVYQTSK